MLCVCCVCYVSVLCVCCVLVLALCAGFQQFTIKKTCSDTTNTPRQQKKKKHTIENYGTKKVAFFSRFRNSLSLFFSTISGAWSLQVPHKWPRSLRPQSSSPDRIPKRKSKSRRSCTVRSPWYVYTQEFFWPFEEKERKKEKILRLFFLFFLSRVFFDIEKSPPKQNKRIK